VKKFFARAKALLPCIALGLAVAQTGSAQTLIVISNYNSLDKAVIQGGTNITFSSNVVVTLSGDRDVLQVTNKVVLNASTFNGTSNTAAITRGSGSGPMFYIHSGASLTLVNLTLSGGLSTNGGAIYNDAGGTLIISNCVFTGNTATNFAGADGTPGAIQGNNNGGSGANGLSASGGAVFSRGTLEVFYSDFNNNTVAAGNGGNGGNGVQDGGFFGGNAGSGGSGGSAQGGAIVCAGPANILCATDFTGNHCAAGSGGSSGTPAAGAFSGNPGSGGIGGSSAGGAVLASGPVLITNCLFTGNTVAGGDTSRFDQAGGSAAGGGLYLASSTNLILNTTFYFNSCQGGAGGGNSSLVFQPAGNGGAAVGGGLASAAALTILTNCTLATNILTGGAAGVSTTSESNGLAGVTLGFELARVAGSLKMADSILFGGTNATATNSSALNYTTYITNTQPNDYGGFTDLGFNFSSDTTVALHAAQGSIEDGFLGDYPLVDTVLSTPGSTQVGLLGGSAGQTLAVLTTDFQVIPGIPGITFPAYDQVFQPRSTPTTIGAYEYNPLISTSGSPPVISLQPSGVTANVGDTVVLAADASSTNAEPLGFQWQLDGTNLADGGNVSGSWTSNLTLTKVALANGGSYCLLVGSSTLTGVSTSAVAVLTVLLPVHIAAQPKSLRVLNGSTATFSVTATGNPPPGFQWSKNNVNLNDLANKISGSTSNVLTINLVTANDAGTYSVLVNNAYSSTNSAPAILTVTPDTTPPAVRITSPTAGQRWSNSTFTVKGTASDNVRVTNVFYQLNGGSWTLAAPSNTTWSNWTANVTLTPGTNTVRAYAVDFSGNFSKPTNSVSFVYVVTAPLAAQTNGRGTVSPDYNGQSLAIGQNYSMTAAATPGAGFAFTNWTGGTNLPLSLLTNKPKLTFLMESNLTLVANFVDVEPPSITITSPTANQRWSNSIFTATGTARDNVQVSDVFCQLNGGGWTPATPGNAAWTNWRVTLTPLQSANVFEAYAVDTSGNKSPTNKVSFLYIPSATLTVRTNGIGSITPVDNGKLLAIGTNYTLTAAPGHNWLFSNWVGGTALPYSVQSASSNYTFRMQSNLVLEANFVTNPFLAVAGVYNGLFYPASGVTEASSGFVTATISSNSAGAYSATLMLDGGTYKYSGFFGLNGIAQTNLPRSGTNPVLVTLTLDLANAADTEMGGSVSNAAADWNSVIQADRAVFSANANPATNYAGHFTLLLPPDAATAPANSPDGCGYAAITNTLGGISTLGGALADGTPFLWSAPIAQNGGVPLYQSLYSGKGSLLGWIYFTNEPPQNVSTNSSFSWIKPAVAHILYPSGFTNLSLTGVLGSPYTNPPGGPVLNLTNATLILSNGNLTNGLLTFTNINLTNNTLTNLAGKANLGPTNYLLLAIKTNNGLETVTFRATGAGTNTIAHGAVLQNQTNALGAFPGTNQIGSLILH